MHPPILTCFSLLTAWLLIFSSSLLPFTAEAAEPDLTAIAHSKSWLELMYYQPVGNGHKSLVTNPKFFIDKKEGQVNPLAELKATLALFQQRNQDSHDQHPQCRYPARYQFLRNHFRQTLQPPVSCPAFFEWTKDYQPSGLELVYASQYVSNPASIFGHTFLLAPSPRQTEAFWMTFNFAADMPPDVSGLAYAWKGITGGFEGDYSLMPYYQRLFMYGNIENRDLWVYPIRLNQEELHQMLRHMWELIHLADFTYYFFDENCAGALLRFFSIHLPELDSDQKLPLYIHPIEVIRRLQNIQRLGVPKFIPSQIKKVELQVQTLNSSQLDDFKNLIRHPNRNQKEKLRDTSVAEAAIEYLAYVSRQSNGQLPPEMKALEREAQVQRAKSTAPPLKIHSDDFQKKAPHLAHQSMMSESGLSVANGEGVFDWAYRFAIHDLLDPEPGFLEHSAFEALHLQMSFQEKAIWFKKATLFRIENFQPYMFFDPSGSWQAEMSFEENLLTSNPTDQYLKTRLATGGTFSFGPHLIYAFLASNLNTGENLPQGRYELGPELGFALRFGVLKAFAQIFYGEGFLENSSDLTSLKASSGLRWTLHSSWSLIQRTEWTKLMDKNQEGYRSSLHLRFYF